MTLFRNMTQANREKLTEQVLTYLSTKRAHQASGNRDGEESVSYLLGELRSRYGWRIGGNLSDFEDLLTALGFTVREVVAGRAVRRYVGV